MKAAYQEKLDTLSKLDNLNMDASKDAFHLAMALCDETATLTHAMQYRAKVHALFVVSAKNFQELEAQQVFWKHADAWQFFLDDEIKASCLALMRHSDAWKKADIQAHFKQMSPDLEYLLNNDTSQWPKEEILTVLHNAINQQHQGEYTQFLTDYALAYDDPQWALSLLNDRNYQGNKAALGIHYAHLKAQLNLQEGLSALKNPSFSISPFLQNEHADLMRFHAIMRLLKQGRAEAVTAIMQSVVNKAYHFGLHAFNRARAEHDVDKFIYTLEGLKKSFALENKTYEYGLFTMLFLLACIKPDTAKALLPRLSLEQGEMPLLQIFLIGNLGNDAWDYGMSYLQNVEDEAIASEILKSLIFTTTNKEKLALAITKSSKFKQCLRGYEVLKAIQVWHKELDMSDLLYAAAKECDPLFFNINEPFPMMASKKSALVRYARERSLAPRGLKTMAIASPAPPQSYPPHAYL